MDLIKSLQAGYADAPNGTATIYLRGTSTAAGYFADAEGYSAITAGTPIALDSSGSAEVYANDMVTIEVRNSSGTLVAEFTPMDAAPTQEVRSLSFTGVDYESAASAVGNPTTSQAIFDRVKASFGAEDWMVDVNGTKKTLTAALSSVSGLFFNVQAPGYGATGDGTTDDTAAIQAAIDAADDSGGTVYFPATASSYRTTTPLSLPSNVSLLGSTPSNCRILLDAASPNMFAQGTAGSLLFAAQTVSNLTFAAAQANTGDIFPFTKMAGIIFSNCRIGSSTYNTPDDRLVGTTAVGGSTTTKKIFIDCEFEVAGDYPFHQDSALSNTSFTRCTFTAKAGARTATFSAPFSDKVSYSNCVFNGSAITSGAHKNVDLQTSANGNARVFGCQFIGGLGTDVGINTPTLGGALTSVFAEAGNTFTSLTTPILYTTNVSSSPVDNLNSSSSRENFSTYVTNATGDVTVDSNNFGNVFVNLSALSTWIIRLKPAYPGARLMLTVQNVASMTGDLSIYDQTTGADVYGWPSGAVQPGAGAISTFSLVYVHATAAGASWAVVREPLSA